MPMQQGPDSGPGQHGTQIDGLLEAGSQAAVGWNDLLPHQRSYCPYPQLFISQPCLSPTGCSRGRPHHG